ncbi:hypothetical protein [Piscinibacter sp.]|jgi:hypothetical protein|uniref:hypothetical protein n=1 Tax=Piscinibacter sp. TaxID=1903157 RepID=UPI00355A9A8B
MTKVLEWFTRDVLGFGSPEHSPQGDGFATFEHIDGGCLGASEFRASASMRFDDAPVSDFAETLPACTYRPTASRRRAA